MRARKPFSNGSSQWLLAALLALGISWLGFGRESPASEGRPAIPDCPREEMLDAAQREACRCEGAEIALLDVGQGSAAAFRSQAGELVLVDAGDGGAGDRILQQLGRWGARRIDLWVFTHYDVDHLAGHAEASAGRDRVWPSDDDLEVGVYWDRGELARPSTQAVEGYLERSAARRREVTAGDAWRGGGVQVEVVARGAATAREENARGLALCIELGGWRIFAPGDLPADESLRAASRCGPVDLWLVNHHGARDGISAALVSRLDPRWSFISAGHQNSHCHPRPSSLAALWGRRVWISAAAGHGPDAGCEAVAAQLDGPHRFAAGRAHVCLGRGG